MPAHRRVATTRGGGVRIHYINLDRSRDRRDEFLRVNGHLSDPVRFPAIDGQRLDLAKLVELGLVTADILENYKPGAVGAALSHASLWDFAARDDRPLTLCEDDAIFNHRFDTCAEAVIRSLPDDWDIILWGWNFDLYIVFELLPGVTYALAQFEQERMRLGTGSFQSQVISPSAFKLLWCFGIPSYTVSPKGGRALRDRLLPFRPAQIDSPPGGHKVHPRFNSFKILGVDGAMNSVYRELNAFVCFPPLVITKNDREISTIQGRE